MAEWFPLLNDTSPASWLLLLPVVSSLLYWALSFRLLARWQRQAPLPPSGSLPPATLFRPIKPGLPGLEEKAALLLRSARPGDRVVFGVSTEAEAQRCLAVCREHTPEGVTPFVIPCPRPGSDPQNPKVRKLIAMTAGSQALAPDAPAHWIITDAEALLTHAQLDAIRREWHASRHTALTTGYRFTSPHTAAELIDRLPLLLTLWPGLMAAHSGSQSRGLGFALGACMAVHRDHLAQIGGWERLLPYLAEDNRLGALLHQQGHTTGLSREILTLEGDPLGWRATLRHHHRIAFTYRVCNPWGTLGMGLTLGLPCALLFALLNPASLAAWSLAALVAAARIIQARAFSHRLACLQAIPFPRFAAGVLLTSIVESAAWLLAWLPLPVRWNDRALRVDRHGRFPTPPDDVPLKTALKELR